jgi:SLA1 Homology Domain 1 (SHD1) protein
VTRLFSVCAFVVCFVSFARGEQAADSALHGADGQLLVAGNVANVTADAGQVRIIIASNSLSLADRAHLLVKDDAESEFRLTFRIWSSSDNKLHVKAKAVQVVDGNVRLLRADNDKAAVVPIAKLSEPDQAFLRRLQRAVEQPKIEPATFSADNPFDSVESFNGSRPAPTQRKREAIAKPANEAPRQSTPSHGTDSEYVDRNPYSERVTGHTATGIPTYTGPRGGQYHYSKSGKKVYEKKK